MNELQKRAKYHRKRQKGMSPFYSPDGGNCILPDYGNSTSISTFNNSTSGSAPTSGMAEDYLQKPFNDDGSQLSRQELLNRIKCWYPHFNEYLRNGNKKSKEQLYMIYNNINEKEKQKIKQFEIENDPRTYQKKQPGVVINDPLYNFEDNEREGEYEVQSSTISLKEELNKLDHESYENAHYCSDLVSMYEGIEDRLSAQDKNELRKLINSTNDADTIAAFLAAKKSQDEDMEDPLSNQTPLCEDDYPCDDDDNWFYYKRSSDENDDAIDEDYQKMDDDWGDPYTTTEIERVLKKLTNNFTSEDGDLRTYYVQEKILAISVLKKYYNIVEVSDGRVDETSEPSWVISYADPKEDLNENLSMNEWYDSPEPDEDNADIFYEVYVVDPGEDISSVMPEVFHDEYEIGDAFDYAYAYALKQHNKGEKHVEIYRCYEDNIGVNRYLEETLYADSDLEEALHKPKSVLSMMKDDGSYKKIQNKILNILPEDSSDESIEITSNIDNGDGTYTVEFTATYKQDGKTEELKREVLYSPETSTYLFYTDESLNEAYPDTLGHRYYRMDIKHVKDSDGFLTDYTWWYDAATDQHIFIFGDSELYTPGDTDPDWETDSEETAQEWWDNYVGPYDDEDYDIEENLNPINEDSIDDKPWDRLDSIHRILNVYDSANDKYQDHIVSEIARLAGFPDDSYVGSLDPDDYVWTKLSDEKLRWLDAVTRLTNANKAKDECLNESQNSDLTEYSVVSYDGKRYSVHYNNVDNSPESDAQQLFNDFRATVSMISPYDDADYFWASIEKGTIKYIKDQKVVSKDFYFNADDAGIENDEWCEDIIMLAASKLASKNSSIQPRMVYESVDLNDDIVFIVHVYESNDELEATDFLGDVKVTIPELIKQYGKGVMNTAMKGITRQEVERNKGIPSNWEIGYLINHIASSKFHELNSDKYFVLGDKIEVENLYSLPDGIKLLQKKLGKMLLPRYDDLEEAVSDLSHPEQEFDSAATSINSNKLPAIYSMVNFNEGDVVIDFGGGKFDNAVEYIKDKGATLLVYDPYNRSAEHNQEVLSILEQNGGADAAVNSNVLNVIKEPEARKAVLQNIKQLTKPGAPIYITVYEGRGDGVEGPTKSGYQLNRKTADYMDEIQEVFPNAKRKGKLIVATN